MYLINKYFVLLYIFSIITNFTIVVTNFYLHIKFKLNVSLSPVKYVSVVCVMYIFVDFVIHFLLYILYYITSLHFNLCFVFLIFKF